MRSGLRGCWRWLTTCRTGEWRCVFRRSVFGAGVITPAATATLLGAIDKTHVGVAAGVLNASRQSGSAFGVAIFGVLMSAVLPVAIGVRVAVCLAIALSLLAALCWRMMVVEAARSRGAVEP